MHKTLSLQLQYVYEPKVFLWLHHELFKHLLCEQKKQDVLIFAHVQKEI